MSLKTRRILFIFFILLFIIITPLVIFYAAGYELSLKNIKKGGFQKNGMLVLDTLPQGAKIFLNNETQQLFFSKYFSGNDNFVATPAKLKNITPGEYDVKMEKDGYFSWEKKLSVYPGMSTYAEDVILFKKSLPLIVANGKIKNIFFSPNKKYSVALLEDKINIIDLENNNTLTVEIQKLNSDIAEVLWSPNNKKIIISKTIYNLSDGSIDSSLNKVLFNNAEKIRWGDDENEIFFSKKEKIGYAIYKYNLKEENSNNRYNGEKIIDLMVKNGLLYYIGHDIASANFNAVEINSGKNILNISLPYSSEYKFINHGQELINLLDEKHQILYLINPFSQFPLQETISNVKYAEWNDKAKLLYGNDFEIWLFDLNSRQSSLITRISETINKCFWYSNNNYIIYSTNTKINILELDNREKRNLLEIVQLDKISDNFLNKKGDALYFVSQIGNEEGLFKLTIQ